MPWYLDPCKKDEVLELDRVKTYNIWNDRVQGQIRNTNCNISGKTFRVNFKSFSDYAFWLPQYTKLVVSQNHCKYKLEDFFGVPECQILNVNVTNIKSLNGLEDRFIRVFHLNFSYLENLKYCPNSEEFSFFSNPLLSYYGITSNSIQYFAWNLCGELTYGIAGYRYDDIPTLEQLNDPKFNSDIFCYFPFEITNSKKSNNIQFNPWNQIYEDPNEVENYDFLFVPFYENSEKFRDKVKEYLPNVDLSGVTMGRTYLW